MGLKYCRRSESAMPGSGRVSVPESCSSLNGPVADPEIESRGGSLNSWEKESNPHNPLYSFSCFLSGHVKGP